MTGISGYPQQHAGKQDVPYRTRQISGSETERSSFYGVPNSTSRQTQLLLVSTSMHTYAPQKTDSLMPATLERGAPASHSSLQCALYNGKRPQPPWNQHCLFTHQLRRGTQTATRGALQTSNSSTSFKQVTFLPPPLLAIIQP